VSVPEERQEGPARSVPLQCTEGDADEGGDEDTPRHDGEVNNYDDLDLDHPWTILCLCYRVNNSSDDIVTWTI
jgi:hypothetical protein